MRSLNDIKSWFKTGKFPTENQFSEAWDSFWHKAESISISAVDSLQKILSSKADRELVDNQVNDLRQNKEDVGVARNLVEAHNVAPDAHQELFNLKANDAEVYHRDVLDSRFASHAEDEELHFTEEEKIKLHNVGKFVTNVGVEAGQQGGLNLMVGSVLPESSAATTVSSLELPLVTDQTNGLLSPAQKSVLDHLAIGDTSLTAEGTPSAVWQLNGSSGPKLKNSGNSFELRNAEDSAYTDLTVNNLSIKGSVVQEGGSFITQAETVEVKDNMILVNKGEISGGVSKGSAGIEVDRGTEENYRMIFDESDDRFKAGKGNDLHVVALRDADAAFADQHFVKWDAATHTFKDGGNSAPASDVYAWAKEPVKPSYSAAEVGAAASNHDHSGVYQPAGSYAPANHSHARSEIADFPTALPASDVYAWAKQAEKPVYTANEVGAAAMNHTHDNIYQPKGDYVTANHTHTADHVIDTATKVMMTREERSKLANFDPGIMTSILTLPSGPLGRNGTVIYQGNAAEIYNIKFVIEVLRVVELFDGTRYEYWDKSMIDFIMEGVGVYEYYVREIIKNSGKTSLFITFRVEYVNNQWTITASWYMEPISFGDVKINLQPTGIIVLKK